MKGDRAVLPANTIKKPINNKIITTGNNQNFFWTIEIEKVLS